MTKKITAPVYHKPGPDQPVERLAYLNRREMEYLKSLGGSGRPGPKGIPSFADDSASSMGVSRGGQGAVGSGSTKTSSGSVSNRSSGGGSTSSGGSSAGGNMGGGGSNNSGSRNPTGGSLSAPVRTAPSSGSSSNSGSRNPTGGALSAPVRTNPSTTPSTTNSNRSPVGPNGPNSGASALQKLENSLRAPSGIKTLNVGPMGTPVSVGKPGPATTIRSNLLGPMGTPPTPVKDTDPLVRNNYSSWLRDKLNGTDSSLLSDVAKRAGSFLGNLSLTGTVSGIGSLIGQGASALYNDPLGSLRTVGQTIVSPITTFNKYALEGQPLFDARGYPTEQAVADMTNIAAGTYLGSSVAGPFAPAPRNALGAMIHPFSAASVPEVRRAYDAAMAVYEKYKGVMSPSELSNAVTSAANKYLGQDASWTKYGIEVAEPFETKVSGIKGVKPYGDVFSQGPATYYSPDLNDLQLIQRPMGSFGPNTIAAYAPIGGEIGYDYGGIRGLGRFARDQLTGVTEVPGPAVGFTSLSPAKLSEYNVTPSELAAHEIGTHYFSDVFQKQNPGMKPMYSGGTPSGAQYYADRAMAADPSLTKKQAEDIGLKIYNGMKEEVAANLMERRLPMSGAERRNTPFSFTPEEDKMMKDSFNLRKKYGMLGQ